MKVQCEKCNYVGKVPDEKLAPGTEFAFKCPKCQHRNTMTVPEPGGATNSPSRDYPDEEDTIAGGEFFEEGAKPALICFDEGPLRNSLIKIAGDLGFTPAYPTSTRDALRRLKVTLFNLVLIQETYDGQRKGHNAIVQSIQPMEMPVRRRMFVVLFGDDYSTLDHMTAFASSVNAVIGMNDQDKFGKILQRALSEHEQFYKVYFTVMNEMGKI